MKNLKLATLNNQSRNMSTNTTNKSETGKNCGTFALHVYISIN